MHAIPTAVPSPPTSFQRQTEWNVYDNTAYHYRVRHPVTVTIQNVAELDSTPVNKNGDVNLAASTTTSVTIFAVLYYSKDPPNQYRRLSALDLKSFALEIWRGQNNDNENDPNDYSRSRHIGDLSETVVAGTKAFTFEMTGPLQTPFGNVYAPGLYITYRYLFLEHNGTKFIMGYAGDDKLSETIANTFEFY